MKDVDFDKLIQECIDENFTKAMDILNTDVHKKKTRELNNVLDFAITAIDVAKHDLIIYTSTIMRNFYDIGFRNGIELATTLLEEK